MIIVKKVISTFLAFALILQTGAFASAKKYEGDNTIPAVEVEDVNGVRTVISSDNYAEYTISFDENAMSLSIIVRELSTGTETFYTVHANDIELMSLTRASSSVSTGSLYAYERTSISAQTEWYLQRPKMEDEGTGSYYFKCWENDSNSSELILFQDAVHNLSQKEADLIGSAGAQAASMFVLGVLGLFITAGTAGLGTTAIGALISSLGFTSAAASDSRAVSLQCITCFERIEDVYYETDNIHF